MVINGERIQYASFDEVVDYTKQVQRYTDANESPDKPVGDCWRTALACLLGVPRDTVPHFAEDARYLPEGDLTWWNKSVIWVEDQWPGWTLICTNADFPVYTTDDEDTPARVISSGPSPRGPWRHSILVDSRTGELVWDPFPGGQGLATLSDVFALVQKGDYS